jgi:hypothetical protein
MVVEFENEALRIPPGGAGTTRKAGSSRVVPSPLSPDSIALKTSLGARRRQCSFARATADRGYGRPGASPQLLLVWQPAKTGQIGVCANPENRTESASIGVNRSESELTILFCVAGHKNPSTWPSFGGPRNGWPQVSPLADACPAKPVTRLSRKAEFDSGPVTVSYGQLRLITLSYAFEK